MGLTDAARAASIATRRARAAAHAAATHLLIQQAREAGATTNAAIAEYVNAHGGCTPWNCDWTRQGIGQFLKRTKGT